MGLTVEERRERARRRTQRERRVAAAGAGAVLLAAAAFAVTQLGGSDTAGGANRSTTDPHKPTTPPQLPGGGRVLLPNYRVVALYGAPQDDQLGELGIGTPAQAAGARSQHSPRGRSKKPHRGQFLGSLAIVAGLVLGLSRQIKKERSEGVTE